MSLVHLPSPSLSPSSLARPKGPVRAMLAGELRLGLTFAGQARAYLANLRALVEKGGLPRQIIEVGVTAAADELEQGAGLYGQHPHGIDLFRWLSDETACPDAATLAAGPLSSP